MRENVGKMRARITLNTDSFHAVSVKQVFLEVSQNLQKETCTGVSYLTKLKETLAQVFSCEFLRNF